MARTTRQLVKELLAEGRTVTEIARVLGVTKGTVCYHRRRLGCPIDEKCNRRYDWNEIQRYYDLGHSARACQAHFGCATKTWYDAAQRGAVRMRPKAMSIGQLLEGSRSRGHLKRRLIAAELLKPHCEECGIDTWRNRPLSLELHHRNGDGQDNRLENLALLCPNCHSQTTSWGGRSRARPEAA